MPNESPRRELELTVRLDGGTIHTGRITLPQAKPTIQPLSAESDANVENVVCFGVGLKIPAHGCVRVVVSLFTDSTCKPQVAFVQVDGKRQHLENGSGTNSSDDNADPVKPTANPLGRLAKAASDARRSPVSWSGSTRTVYDAQGRGISETYLPHDQPPETDAPPEPDTPPDDPHIVG